MPLHHPHANAAPSPLKPQRFLCNSRSGVSPALPCLPSTSALTSTHVFTNGHPSAPARLGFRQLQEGHAMSLFPGTYTPVLASSNHRTSAAPLLGSWPFQRATPRARYTSKHATCTQPRSYLFNAIVRHHSLSFYKYSSPTHMERHRATTAPDPSPSRLLSAGNIPLPPPLSHPSLSPLSFPVWPRPLASPVPSSFPQSLSSRARATFVT